MCPTREHIRPHSQQVWSWRCCWEGPDNTLRSCIAFTCSLSCFLLPGSWAGQLGFWEVKGQGHQIREGAWAWRQTLGVPVVTCGFPLCVAEVHPEGSPAPTGLSTHQSKLHRRQRTPPTGGVRERKQSKGHRQEGSRPDSLLPSFPDHCDPLTVFRPSNVLDLPSERLILILQEVLLLRGIPDPQFPRYICGHNRAARATFTTVLGPRGHKAWPPSTTQGFGAGRA